MPDALSGQNYVDTVRDRRGNAIGGAVVDVLDSNTQVTYLTVTSNDAGRYVIPLTGPLADRVLVDLRFSGPFETVTIAGITLL